MVQQPNEYPVVRIVATYRVVDPEKLVAFARRRLQEAWHDDLPPDDLAEAVYEAVIGSNMNPDNSDLGIEEISDQYLFSDLSQYQQIDGPTYLIEDEGDES